MENQVLCPNRRILILVNHDVVIYNFRLELVERLISEGYEVHISSPYGERINDLVTLGVEYHEITIERHGMNPIRDANLIIQYRRLIKDVNPVVILSYTIKPNIYGGIVANICGIPFYATITGLGMAVENGGILQKILVIMYKFAFKNINKVFFQNEENARFFKMHKIVMGKQFILPGSGVNLSHFRYISYPDENDGIIFITVGRIMEVKGINELLETARRIKEKYSNVNFYLIGFYDEDYERIVNEAVKSGIVHYVGQQIDVRPYYAKCHAIIHPGHYEGMSNVCLEAAAVGRPILASRIHGCIETFDEGKSGFCFEPQDVDSLMETLERFIDLPHDQKEKLGIAGRNKMEREFDRNKVVDIYMQEIRNETNKN